MQVRAFERYIPLIYVHHGPQLLQSVDLMCSHSNSILLISKSGILGNSIQIFCPSEEQKPLFVALRPVFVYSEFIYEE